MTKQQCELLLIEDVEGLGRSGDITMAKAGYARNFLLPKKMAVLADNNARRMQERLRAERLKRAAVDKEQSEAVASRVNDITITTTVKVDHDGTMYGSVSAVDIVSFLEQEGIAIEKRSVQLKHPIKQVGTYDINLKLKEDVVAAFKLKVLPEEGSEYFLRQQLKERERAAAVEETVVEEFVVEENIEE